MSDYLVADLKSFTNYEYKLLVKSDTSSAAVFKFVNPRTKVLEIGAGSGSISRPLVQKKNVDLVALEINPSAIVKLKTITKKVHSLDLNQVDWPTGGGGKIRRRHCGGRA